MKPGSGSQEAPSSPPPPCGDQLVLCVATERGAAVFGLPSQRQIAAQSFDVGAGNGPAGGGGGGGQVARAACVSWVGDRARNTVLLLFTQEGKIKGWFG